MLAYQVCCRRIHRTHVERLGHVQRVQPVKRMPHRRIVDRVNVLAAHRVVTRVKIQSRFVQVQHGDVRREHRVERTLQVFQAMPPFCVKRNDLPVA